MNKLINKLKIDTNNLSDIVYRYKDINNTKICIIYSDSLSASDKISDFIIESLDKIDLRYKKGINLYEVIKNDIENFKVIELTTYQDMCYYINSGFTIILFEDNKILALETKKNLSRGITNPLTEKSYRGPMDCFIEEIQTNIGLIKRRIKDNNLWMKEYKLGTYTQTKTNLIYINNLVEKSFIDLIDSKLKNIDIKGIITVGNIKNLIQKENGSVLPTIMTTERPDLVVTALLKGKVVIMCDNDPFALILPTTLNDFFITTEDNFNKSINISFTRIIRYLSFFISLLTPALYIAITTYNQEIIPTELMISIASQRESVPFSAFVEAAIMILAFEILRESDLKIPSFASSAISIVGALVLGEAAVNAGIVSPIMIIVIAITAISSLTFTEPEMINALRWYRLIFMIGSTILGLYGTVFIFILFIIRLCNINSFTEPYLVPFAPTNIQKLKNSIIKFPIKNKEVNNETN